jgi:nucleoside-diphosphate-sugar epimerase
LNGVCQGEYDIIFHQAAVPRVSYSVEQPWHTSDVNISKTVRLFEAARGAVSRIVWASSSSVYGGSDLEKLPIKETTTKNPKSPYAWQKSAIEDFAKMCWDLYDLDVVCLRYFNVYGPGQYGDSPYATAVSAWCHSIKNGLECRSDGDGEQSRDMCYIDNIVSANIQAANCFGPFKGECYNVACGDRVSNNEILDYLKAEFGNKVKIKHAPERAGDVKHTQADITKICREIDYSVKVRFWEGLEETVKWWGISNDK